MKLKYYFLILALCIVALAAVALYSTFSSQPLMFYVTEGFIVLLLIYLWFFYHKTLRPYDTLIGGMELVKDMDLTTRLAVTGQYETDIIVHTFNDLMNRLRSEHLTLEEQYTFLSLLIEASPMGIVQCDLEGRITSMNPAARQMLSPFVEEAMKALPLGQETTVRLPGGPQLYSIRHLSFPDRGYQHPFYMIESLTDEIRRAEKAAYERVIRMIAHEVNNSVAGIIGQIQNSNSIILNDAGERLKTLSAFVTRFAEVVKIPRPQMQLCDLSEEVDACRPFLESLCTATRTRLEFHLTDEASPVRMDTVLFQQVLINIVKNSIESIQGAEGRVTITTTPSELMITDNGRGISAEVSQHLFTPFYTTKPQGQGLGLLLIRDILTAHGCTFSLLTNPEDHLTRFSIQFP
jgi:signal transduction histidine kinase